MSNWDIEYVQEVLLFPLPPQPLFDVLSYITQTLNYVHGLVFVVPLVERFEGRVEGANVSNDNTNNVVAAGPILLHFAPFMM